MDGPGAQYICNFYSLRNGSIINALDLCPRWAFAKRTTNEGGLMFVFMLNLGSDLCSIRLGAINCEFPLNVTGYKPNKC